ncbi:hypothetical protein Ais01nite_05160 [Asanoa ishikariensis]|uniref:Glycerol uptake facilitator protein/aquaporin Z n=1 Tax=Asanoa ishikariensis TaxID=137265 RepID=A0A1H3TGC9_9ACTN|nr:aquaporin [Asanoa ishikariensis]GIF62481.1 hypothetical protein Ais01nite_05160 [Asanoa ishikariensis]SDZ49343.1 glycerol uptake facilitator protein/aquaporin Z [Asanoa ishikariensis]
MTNKEAHEAGRLSPTLTRAADEFVLTTVLLFLALTVIRWLRDPSSPLFVADLGSALAVVGAVSGVILTALILSPLGRRSGGHMNPAVTLTLWLMRLFPGRNVLPYVLAQLAGSAAGTFLGRLVWGSHASTPTVNYAAIRPAPTWQPVSVFVAEVLGMLVLIALIGFLLDRPSWARTVPYVIGIYVGLVIALLGPLSGGSINPARQLGPALLSGQSLDLWIYLVAPMLGAALGVLAHRLLAQRIACFTTPLRRHAHTEPPLPSTCH